MATSLKTNFMPPSLISNLQQVLALKSEAGEKHASEANKVSCSSSSSSSSCSLLPSEDTKDKQCPKPVVLVTNGEGIESPGLTYLVQALLDSHLDVYVCAPKSDRSVAGHSVTVGETISVSSAQINGATAFEVSGTPADCVSLALSGSLFSNFSKPALVVSGINRGSSSGINMFYSGAVAGAREALLCGVPSLCLSMNWKKDVNCESDMKDAATVCSPLICAAVRSIQEGLFPKSCLLNFEIPSCPLRNKGFKVTKQSQWRSSMSWKAVSTKKHHPPANFMSSQQSLGIQLAQLGREASIAGAARRLNSQRKNEEIESVGVARKMCSQKTIKFFRLEFLEEQQENVDKDLDIRALEDGFVAITPICLSSSIQSDIQMSVSNWISSAVLSKNQLAI
ncbi:uncharacterized protein LOC126793351 [Argentina anserina]|uniref:uncharacterized protein LOC126793351 n=1 Tax=Argentina anserina TaxID=57926 RepID=UPI00217623FD|nr:uncharacterized protein LOC126793351 [Potentilla anserina]